MTNANGEKERMLPAMLTSNKTKISSLLTSAIQKKLLGTKILISALPWTINKSVKLLNASGLPVNNLLEMTISALHQRLPEMSKTSNNAFKETVLLILLNHLA
jgi:hypothetical protein